MKENIITYARKSPDDKDKTEQSITNQDKLFNRVSNDKNWKIYKRFYDRNISGGDRSRKGIKDAIECAIYHEIKIIVVKDQDRFARDIGFFQNKLLELQSHGILVFDCMKGGFLSSDDLGDNIKALIGEDYINKSRQRAYINLDDLKEDKRPVGNPPYGYLPKRKLINNKYVIISWKISPKKAEKVKKVIERYKQKYPLKPLLNELRIDKSQYYRIIKSYNQGIYHGYVVYDKKLRNKDKVILRVDKIKYKGNFEPIFKND